MHSRRANYLFKELRENDMASRDKKDLNNELAIAFDKAVEKYKLVYPNLPQPFITCTYRSNEEQNILFSKRPKVTNAKAGQSPHNFNPSFAFDIGFIGVNKQMDWSPKYFKLFAEIIKQYSPIISWGGDWSSFKDAPHFEHKNWKKLI